MGNDLSIDFSTPLLYIIYMNTRIVLIIAALVLSACGKAPGQAGTSSVCGVVYTEASEQGGVIIDASAAKPLPFAGFKTLENNEVLLKSGTYITESNCYFSVKDNQAQFIKQN